MRFSVITLSSFVMTFLIIWKAYSRKKQFYPSVIYLTSHQPFIAILLFQCAVLLFMFAKVVTRIFFGRLQRAEVDDLVSESWYVFFDMCLVFAFFQDELGTEFLFLFFVLLFVRALHWLIERRVDYMERTPVINALFHARVISLIFILACVDAYYIKSAYWKPVTHGLSVHMALGVEYFVLMLSLFTISVRYVMHSIDSMREHPWDKKAMYLLYVDIIVGIVRLALYIEFTTIMWRLHPFPLFVARPIYTSVRALKKAIRDVIMSRWAIRYLNTVFPDATNADLAASSDTICIICREDMQIPADGQQSENSPLKRLPCSHIFHASCLRSWFQRQQICPTCRMDIVRQVRQQELQGQQARRDGGAQPPASAGGPTTSTTSGGGRPGPSTSQAGADNNGRPPWLPMQGQMPFFLPYGFPPPPTTSTTGNSTVPTTSFSTPVPPPLFPPPFFGMPIIYPGNLFPNATSPMPEPPSGSPDSVSEARLRASAEARFTALRQINVLLNAAVLQMNAYLNACTGPVDTSNPWLSAFGDSSTSAPDVAKEQSETGESPKKAVETPRTQKIESTSVEAVKPDTEDSELKEVRKRRLERFQNQSSEAKAQGN
ncbi:unnamed protein product [Calicophoron daubneyi]|uniref:RING-type E3 ubiquitin transferase n=1 Tax=Calicophoron daubneyi TaxID=300641 RepID=A0AAV2TKA9_CALDB